jgi:membrane-associated phospholipid phosphatase
MHPEFRTLAGRLRSNLVSLGKNPVYLAVIGGLILTVTVMAVTVQSGILRSFDRQSIIGIQRTIPHSLDLLLSVFSLIGSFELTTFALFGIIAIRRRPQELVVLPYYFTGLALEILGKSLIRQSGPPSEFFRYALGFLFPTSQYQTGFSFPSGHALRTSFLVLFGIWMTVRSPRLSSAAKFLTVAAQTVFLLVMLVSRVSLGEHWTSDVVAGTILGLGFGGLALIHAGVPWSFAGHTRHRTA